MTTRDLTGNINHRRTNRGFVLYVEWKVSRIFFEPYAIERISYEWKPATDSDLFSLKITAEKLR